MQEIYRGLGGAYSALLHQDFSVVWDIKQNIINEVIKDSPCSGLIKIPGKFSQNSVHKD